MTRICPVLVPLTRSGRSFRRRGTEITGQNGHGASYGRVVRIFRATVRGQFDGLDEEQQAALRARADEHDILQASFSREGTFVYSPALTWFNLRYELRSPDEATDEEVEAEAIGMAQRRMDADGFGHKHLRVDLMDMAAVWDD